MTRSPPATRHPSNSRSTTPDRDQERVRLGRIWEHPGFTHHLDGAFVCDPGAGAGELDNALDELTEVVLG